MNSAPDVLADTLGRVVAQLQREWRKEVERIELEGRAIIAELKLQVGTLKNEIISLQQSANERIDRRLAEVKDGEPGQIGPVGPMGPAGDNGRDGVDGKDGRDGIDGMNGRDGIDGAPGKDGEPGLNGRDGADGQPGTAGKDGRDGIDGKDGAPGKDGRDGIDGVNGKDGAGINNVNIEFDGERKFCWEFTGADETKTFSFEVPWVLDRGVYKADMPYARGDGVTWGGSFWVAQADMAKPIQPGTPNSDWRLAVKRGRDGRDGSVGPKGDPGKDGAPGRDLTQIGPDGSKW